MGLRRDRLDLGTELWRIDTAAPATWSWDGFRSPHHRFDPVSGAFRVRYAGRSIAGAARERYRDSGLFIPADHSGHHLVQLIVARHLHVLDLRREQNLDVLEIDDQISTGQHLEVWNTCHRLVDAARRWWTDLDAMIYRSRTTTATSANVAFFAADAFQLQSRSLAQRPEVLADLVLHYGFTIGWRLTP
ncbi:MAG: RES family NAD+ phosphorylase [Acidimicrobiales bacterium]